MVIYGIFIMAVGKAAMHRSYLYPHNPTFGALSQGRARFFLRKSRSFASFSAQTMLGTRVAQQYAVSGRCLLPLYRYNVVPPSCVFRRAGCPHPAVVAEHRHLRRYYATFYGLRAATGRPYGYATCRWFTSGGVRAPRPTVIHITSANRRDTVHRGRCTLR